MRTGGHTLNQSLTPEAASIVKQAVSLARRRGHAQVTPLHVASAMFASSMGLLRRACLHSHSHPLQCKALELCFNVALNRLPTSTSSPLLSLHSHLPSLSNALVAALKRAQAHQRRGSIDNQQQPILALKVELEQLVISILDDPGVSRVMREAGFSSTQVKSNVEHAVSLENFPEKSKNVEKAVSLEICSQGPSILSNHSKESTKPFVFSTNVTQFPFMSQSRMTLSRPTDQARNADIMSVLDSMMIKKRKNTVIIGESLAGAAGLIRGVIDKFDSGEVPGELRFVQFISVPLFSLRNLSRQEVEHKLWELRCLVRSHVFRGVVLYLGDLNWILEFRSSFGEQRRNYYYCAVEHMVMEIGRLLSGVGESGKLWLMGVATFHTYMRCKTGNPSLETLWELHPLTIPVGSLALSLNLESDSKDQFRGRLTGEGFVWLGNTGAEKHLTCCADCLVNFQREAQSVAGSTHNNNESNPTSISSGLPSWLQQYKEESRKEIINDQESEKIRDLCKKWNSICSAAHKQPHFLENALNNLSSSSSPSSSASVSSYDRQSPKLNQPLLNWPVIFESNQSPKEHQFLLSENEAARFEPNSGIYIPFSKPDLLSNPNSSPNSASSSEVSEDMECRQHRFKELNSESFKNLCNILERKVPRHRDIIPEIVSTILRCRAGIVKRKGKLKHREEKQETWLFFSGVDHGGKQKIARELAKALFGSQTRFFAMGLSSFSSTATGADSTEACSSKRARDEHGRSYLERFANGMQENPSRVFFMEDVDQVDYHSQMGIKKAIESGRITLPGGDLVPLKNAIVIFSCETFSSVSRACSPPIRQKLGEDREKESRTSTSLDLNVANGDDDGDEQLVSGIGILESVDSQVMFKIQVV